MEKTNCCVQKVVYVCNTADKNCKHFKQFEDFVNCCEYRDDDRAICTCKQAIAEANPPKRKPLPDGVLPLTDDELEEFSKINGFTVEDVQYDGTYIHLNKRDYMGLCYVKAILWLANLFDLEM